MSGICGVWALDGSAPEIGPILARLERRGPEGARAWNEGPVALGHTLLATTPEALVEVLPLTEPGSGCTVTADARLDNREELITALDLGCETRTIGDGELILRAYLRWGEECPRHLLGDFAFAIWDPRVPRLFCARDHMGIRQLIYHRAPGTLFAFATEADALVAHARIPKTLNEGRIADYLDSLEGFDFKSTFFENIFRLEPAHWLSVSEQGLSSHRYWSLAPGPRLMLDRDQDYAAAFLSIFTETVRCRLRSAGQVGSMLSGGLDSNSVAAVAARMLAGSGTGPLMTFSAVSADPACAESKAIRTSAQSDLLTPKFVHSDDQDDASAEISRLANDCAEPFDGPMVAIAAVYRLAQKNGVKVLLDGVAADITLTAGNRVASLIRRGNVLRAISEALGERRYWGPAWPVRTILSSAVWSAAAPASLRRLRRRLVWRREDRQTTNGKDTVSSDFAVRSNLAGRRKHFRTHLRFVAPTSREFRQQAIAHPHLVVARERYDRIAGGFGIEPRDPFMDIRLIQFCLSLPDRQLQAGGWPKIILRHAMSGLVPHSVVWKRRKDHVGWAFTTAVMDAWPDSPAALANDEMLMSKLGNVRANRALEGVDRMDWFKLTILSKWLDRHLSDGRSMCKGKSICRQ